MSTASPTPKDAPKAAKSANGTNDAHANAEFPITLEVLPRQPRLAWRGMDQKELANDGEMPPIAEFLELVS